MVNVPTPETGSIGPSPHKSVTFNNQSMKEKLEQQMKELEEKKSQAERAVKAAEEAAKKRAVAASA
jgi:nuclear polyadenylated RNA-binding protein NAB2